MTESFDLVILNNTTDYVMEYKINIYLQIIAIFFDLNFKKILP